MTRKLTNQLFGTSPHEIGGRDFLCLHFFPLSCFLSTQLVVEGSVTVNGTRSLRARVRQTRKLPFGCKSIPWVNPDTTHLGILFDTSGGNSFPAGGKCSVSFQPVYPRTPVFPWCPHKLCSPLRGHRSSPCYPQNATGAGLGPCPRVRGRVHSVPQEGTVPSDRKCLCQRHSEPRSKGVPAHWGLHAEHNKWVPSSL